MNNDLTEMQNELRPNVRAHYMAHVMTMTKSHTQVTWGSISASERLANRTCGVRLVNELDEYVGSGDADECTR